MLKASGKGDLEVVDIDEDIGFALCKLDRIDGIVMGSFTKAGDVFATSIKVLDVRTKRILKSANSQGNGVGSILENQIDELSQAVSQGVEIPSQQLAVADVTTHSMEAYRFYLEGMRFFHQFLFIAARTNQGKAVELDPAFAMAYFYLARANRQLGNTLASRTAIENAMTYSVRATEKEALFIKADYAWRIESDYEKSIGINTALI